jgi:hypothetical protein
MMRNMRKIPFLALLALFGSFWLFLALFGSFLK